MKHLKIGFLFILILAALSFTGCSDNTKEAEKQVEYEILPAEAKTFVSRYFGGKDNVEKVIEIEAQNMVIFQVNTINGFQLTFNSDGIWQEIDAPDGESVPKSILPEPVQQTLSERYYGYGVTEINREGENYHVVLSNNQGGDSLDFIINQSGEIIQTGEMD